MSLIFAILATTYIYLAITVPVEEAKLRRAHGKAFEEYARRVPKFIPRISLHTTPTELRVRLSGLRAEFLRMLQWSSIPMACYLIEHLRMMSWWPTFFGLP